MADVIRCPWIEGLTIGEVLRRTAEKFPDRDAIVFPGLDAEGESFPPSESAGPNGGSNRGPCYRLTYRQLDEAVDRVAGALLGLGIEKGEHVAVWATNWPQWVLLQFATARIGAVLVTINPAYRSSELAYVLKQSDAKALFLIDRFRTSNYFAMLAEAVPELGGVGEKPSPLPLSQGERGSEATPVEVHSVSFPRLRHVVAMRGAAAAGMWSWDGFLSNFNTPSPGGGEGGGEGDSMAKLPSPLPLSQGERGSMTTLVRVAERAAELDPNDPINIQYTSGTTGFPKGATLTHRNLLFNAYYIGECQRITEADRICIPVPFYHCFGCVLGVLCAAVQGAAMIVPAEYFNAEATLEAIAQEKATAIYGVPTMFIAQLEHPRFADYGLSSLRTGIMAGSPCPIELMKRVVNEMGAREITIAYGLTEASPVITQTRTDDPLELRVTTVGRPIPGFAVKLVDPATGAVLRDNQQGELCARGHGVMLGYYNMPDATAAAIDADGWLHSGDLAVRLPNGYYRITGRIKDMICRGGENIYPREIEEFLYTHPAVQDVAVVGVPDPKFVEEVAAWIRLKEHASATEEEIRDFCRERMAHFKVPRYIRFVTEYPQTVTGKIQKFKIREAMIAELGLEQAETA